MDLLRRAYYYVFYERQDPRVKDWPLVSSPVPLFIIIVTYLALIKVILPIHMRKRKAYQLRGIIKWYNIASIVANAVVSWGIATSGYTAQFNYGFRYCIAPDYSNNPTALRMLRFLWWTIILKLMELVETIFFVLRNKERQASFLHVYHHISTLVIVWCGTKYVGGGITSFSPMINNAMHVVMYTYYLLSAEGSPTVKAFLRKYKKWLTIMQIVQITMMLLYSIQVFMPGCHVPMGITLLYFPSVVFVYYMFFDFYKRNYVKKTDKKRLNIRNGNTVKKKSM